VICKYIGSVVDRDKVLVIFGSVVVVCEYDKSVVDVYWDE
jgi:hypothetical protein